MLDVSPGISEILLCIALLATIGVAAFQQFVITKKNRMIDAERAARTAVARDLEAMLQTSKNLQNARRARQHKDNQLLAHLRIVANTRRDSDTTDELASAYGIGNAEAELVERIKVAPDAA